MSTTVKIPVVLGSTFKSEIALLLAHDNIYTTIFLVSLFVPSLH